MVVGGVVAVRREGERKAVFEKQDFGGAGGGEATDADIGPEAKGVFAPGMNAGDLPESFFGCHDDAFAEDFCGDDFGSAGETLQVCTGGEDAPAGDAKCFGQGSDGKGDVYLQVTGCDGDALFGSGEARRRGQEAVSAGRKGKFKMALGIRQIHRFPAIQAGNSLNLGPGDGGAGGILHDAADGY